MADGDSDIDVDYVETVLKRVKERTRFKAIAEELLQSQEYSPARDVLQKLLLTLPREDREARFNTLLQIAECDLALEDRITTRVDEEILSIVDQVFKSYYVVVENAKTHEKVAGIIVHLYACKLAKQQASPNDALSEIEKCMSSGKSNISVLAKTADTKKMAYKSAWLMEQMMEELKDVKDANPDLRAFTLGSCLNKIGYLYNDLHRSRLAKPFLQNGLDAMEKQFGEDAVKHHIFASLANNLGFCYSEENEHVKAAWYYGKAMTSLQKAEDCDDNYRNEWISKYEKHYMEHISDPSVDPSDVARISDEIDSLRGNKPSKKKPKDLEKDESDIGHHTAPGIIPAPKVVSDNPADDKNGIARGTVVHNFFNVGKGIQVDHSDVLQDGHSIFKGKLQGEDVAVKRAEFRASNMEQVEALVRLGKHPNTVKYLSYSVLEVAEMPGQKYTYIAMELCDRHSLYELTEDETFTEKDRLRSLLQLMIGLSYIHGNGIVHGDLQPNDILRSLDARFFKIAGSGLSINQDGTSTRTGRYGILDEPPSEKSDVYSAGLVFCHVLSFGKFTNITDFSPLVCSDLEIAKDLVEQMLQNDPGKRPTADEVLKHPFFWDIDKRLSFYRDITDSFLTTAADSSQTIMNELNQTLGRMFKQNWIDDILDNAAVGNTTAESLISELKIIHSSPPGTNDIHEVPVTQHYAPTGIITFIGEKYHQICSCSEPKNACRELWGFFSSRFPNLFMEAYHTIHQFEAATVDFNQLYDCFNKESKGQLEPIWTTRRKMLFVCKVLMDETLVKVYEKEGPAIFGEGWMTKLALDKTERKSIQANILERGNKMRVEKWAIFNRASESPHSDEMSYNERSLRSLLHFIMNLDKFFQEEENQVQAIFMNNRNRIWEFFEKRFPDMFDKLRRCISRTPLYGCILSDIMYMT